jgi:NADH-quinone oxidoreductase subunit F
VLSTRFKDPDGTWFEAYVEDGGYLAARKALTTMTAQQVIDEVSKSILRGLGSAGSSTVRKWSFIPKQSTKPKYLVANADDGEPGTFKGRYILERDPYALLEGILIAVYAIGSHKAYVYIRGEYFRPSRFQHAIDEAYRQGWLGKNIQGIGFDLDMVIHRGAGAYIFGEETALLTSLEGRKACRGSNLIRRRLRSHHREQRGDTGLRPIHPPPWHRSLRKHRQQQSRGARGSSA